MPLGQDSGKVSGVITLLGEPVERNVIALSYHPIDLAGSDDGAGFPLKIRQVMGTARSNALGEYQIDLEGFLGEVIIIALDDYGDRWTPGTAFSVGDIIRPTPGNETGYVYRCLVPGGSFPTEPAWWINAGGNETGSVGSATFEAIESWWPLAHAPVVPEFIAYDGVLIDEYFNDIVLLTHAETSDIDVLLDPFFSDVVFIMTGDPQVAANAQDITDQGPVGYALNLLGTPALTAIEKPPGSYTGSIAFDGNGDEIKTAVASTDFGFHPNAMTVDFWIKLRPDADPNYIVTNRDGTNTANRWNIERRTDNRLAFYMRNAAAQQSSSITDIALTDDTWHHVAFVLQGTNGTWFIDGVQRNTTASMIRKPSEVSDNLQIGASSPDPLWDFNGWLAQLRITRAARYTESFTLPSAPLPLQRSTYYNGIVNQISNALQVAPARYAYLKEDAGAAQFGTGSIDTIDSWIDILSSTQDQPLYFSTADYTLEFAIKLNTHFDGKTILDTAFNGVSNGIALRHNTGGGLVVTIGGVARFTTSPLTAGPYYHLAFSRNSGVTRFFLQGIKQGNDINDGSNLLLQQIRIGANASGLERISGNIDEIRITKAGRYTENFAPPIEQYPDSKYEIGQGDAAVYEWIDALILNHNFMQGSGFDNWIRVVYGGLTADFPIVITVMVDDSDQPASGTRGWRGGGVNRQVNFEQTIAIPSNIELMNLRAFLYHDAGDQDCSGIFVQYFDDQGQRIKGFGDYHRTTSGNASHSVNDDEETVGPLKEYIDNTTWVPPGAVTAKIGWFATRQGLTTHILSAGGDNVRIRWGRDTNSGYRPAITKLPIANEDFWLGNFAGWEITGNPYLDTGNEYVDTGSYAMVGGSNSLQSDARQTVAMPAGEFNYANCIIHGTNGGEDCDQATGHFLFKNINDTVLLKKVVPGAKGGSEKVTGNRLVAIPPGTAKIEAILSYRRVAGAVLNASVDWVRVDLMFLYPPQIEALTPNA